MVSEDDIKRAFGRFQVCGFRLPENLIYGPAEQLKVMVEEWADLFKFTEPATFLLAVPLVLKKCKFWPKPSDMWEAIEEVKRTTLSEIKRNEEKSRAPAKDLDPQVKALIADVLEKRDFARSMEIEKDVIDEARAYFPDISEKLIRQNYCEFRQLADQRKVMLTNPNGTKIIIVPKMDATGYVRLVASCKGDKK